MNRVTGLNENKSKDADVVPAGVQIGTGITPRFVRFTLGLAACANRSPTDNTRNIETAVSSARNVFMGASLVCAMIMPEGSRSIKSRLIVVYEEKGRAL